MEKYNQENSIKRTAQLTMDNGGFSLCSPLKFYTRKDIQSILSIGKTKATQLLKDGIIQSTRYGNEYRVSQAHLDEYLISVGLLNVTNLSDKKKPILSDSVGHSCYNISSSLKKEYPAQKVHDVLLPPTTEVKTEMKPKKKKYKKQGNPFKRECKNGYTWTVRYSETINGKKKTRYKGGFKTKAEAEFFMHEVNALIQTGKYIATSDMKVKEFILKWFENNYLCFENLPDGERQYSANTINQYSRDIHKRIIPYIGDFKLQNLHRDDVKNFYIMLRTEHELSANSIRLVNSVLKKSLADAVEENLIPKNPCTKVWRPTIKRTKFRVLSTDEQKALRKLLLKKPGTSSLPLLILLETGMRRGESLGIKFSDCNFSKNTIKLQRQVTLIGNEELENGKTKEIYGITEYMKTEAAYRTIDVSPELMKLIKKQQLEVKKQKLKSLQYNDLDLVCCHEDGSCLMPKSVYREFKRTLDKNGLPNIRLHDLRGTFITMMHKEGVPLIEISKYVGHEDVSTTAGYLHETGEDKSICSSVIRKNFYSEAQ